MTSISRLPIAYQTVLSTRIANAFGYDRITLLIDHPSPELPISQIIDSCGGCTIFRHQNEPYWQCEVRIFQPSKKTIKIIDHAVRKGRYRAKIVYVELAWDLIVDALDHAKSTARFVLGHLMLKYKRKPVECDHSTTFYYERRSNGPKSPHVFVIYFDQPSELATKWAGKACCHMEHRFFGSPKLHTIGISTLQDILDFDHLCFWRDTFALFSLPKKKDIGKSLSNFKETLSDTAYIKKADTVLDVANVEGYFVLQNFKLSYPEFFRKKRLEMDNSHLFREP